MLPKTLICILSPVLIRNGNLTPGSLGRFMRFGLFCLFITRGLFFAQFKNIWAYLTQINDESFGWPHFISKSEVSYYIESHNEIWFFEIYLTIWFQLRASNDCELFVFEPNEFNRIWQNFFSIFFSINEEPWFITGSWLLELPNGKGIRWRCLRR